MRSSLCFVMLVVAVVQAVPLPFNQAPANIDTPDDQDEVNPAGGVNPQGGGSSFFYPTGGDTSSSSSSSSEEVDGSEMPDGDGSIPIGTAPPSGGNPVAGSPVASNPGPASGTGTGRQQGGRKEATGQGKQGISDQNSDEQAGQGAPLVAGDTAALSKIQAQPKSDNTNSGAGKSAGIAIGVLGLVTVATAAIIFAIRKRRNGFMRFYSQANAEL